MDRRGLVWQVAGDYLIATCYGSPRDEVFVAMVDWVRSSGVRVAGILLEDRRGWLASLDLRRTVSLARELDAPAMLLSDSPLVAVAARVARWLGRDVRTGPRGAVDRALERLAVPAPQRATVKAAVHALRVARALGGSRRRRSTDASSQTPIPVG